MPASNRATHSTPVVLLLLSVVLLVSAAADDDGAVSPSISIDAIPSPSHRSLQDAVHAASVSLSQASHIVTLHDDSYDAFVRNKDRLSVLLFYTPWNRRSLQFISDLSDASDLFAGQDDVAFAVVNCANHKTLCKHAKVTHFPHLRVVVRGNTDRFHAYSSYHESVKEIAAFISTVRATDRRRAVRESEVAAELAARPVPLFHPTPGIVYELDPELFEVYAMSTQLLVMVLFYAPWCASCSGMHQTLLEVADYFATDRKVSIAKVDCERYQTFCIGKNIEGYPTLITYAKPIISKGGMKYEGELSSADLKNYLDLQNFYTHSDELTAIKAQFEKYSKMSEADRPLDPADMGGIFGTFAGMKPSEKPERIGKDPRKPLEEEWKW